MSSAQSAIKAAVPAHVPPELVFDFDIYNPPGAEIDFHGALKRLHDENYPDIFWSTANGGHWVATRGEDIHKIFADYQNFSSRSLTVPASSAPPFPLFPIFADPPEHGLYRALLNPSFSPKAVASLEARARALAVKLVEDLRPRGRCDFVIDFAQHLPIEVFMSIVDVPAGDSGGTADASANGDGVESKPRRRGRRGGRRRSGAKTSSEATAASSSD